MIFVRDFHPKQAEDDAVPAAVSGRNLRPCRELIAWTLKKKNKKQKKLPS